MKTCPDCFSAPTWIPNANATPSIGECDFGHVDATQVWPVNAWQESLERLLESYEVVPSTDGTAKHLEAIVQDDWNIFTFEKLPQVRQFLEGAIEGHPFLVPGIKLELSSDSSTEDHVALWEKFSTEIRQRNRYFPSATLNLNELRRFFQSCEGSIRAGDLLYRARKIAAETQIDAREIGPPPAGKATAGRANPAGIPYLYLALLEKTALHEVRASHQSEIAVGEFEVNSELRVLNLANLHHPDIFEDDAVAGLRQYRYLRRLGDELGRPVKESDQQIDYVPTQYLCEYAKELEFDGVVYPSAVDPNERPGRNIVLFSSNKVQWTGEVTRYRAEKIEASFTEIAIAE